MTLVCFQNNTFSINPSTKIIDLIVAHTFTDWEMTTISQNCFHNTVMECHSFFQLDHSNTLSPHRSSPRLSSHHPNPNQHNCCPYFPDVDDAHQQNQQLERSESKMPMEVPEMLQFIPPETFREAVWLIKLGGPLAISFLASQACNLITIHFQGGLGGNFLAACSFCVFTLNCITSFIVGINSGIDSLATQSCGAGLHKNVGYICLRAFFFQLLAFPVWLLLLIFSGSILNGLGFDPEVTPLSQGYLRICTWGILPLIIVDTIRRACAADGNPFPSFFASLFSFILSYPLNHLMVITFGYGAVGSAYTFNIINWLTCACLLAYCYLSGVYKKTWPERFDVKLILSQKDLWLYLTYALPATGSILSEFASFEVCVVIAAQISKNDVAGNLLIFAVQSFIANVPMSYGVAGATRIGHLLGANSPARAKHAFIVLLQMTLLTQVGLAIIVLFLSNTIGTWFTQDEIVLDIVSSVIPLLAIFCVVNGLSHVMSGILRGIGKQRFMLVTNVLCYWILAMPLAYYLALHVSEHTYISDLGERLTMAGTGIMGTWLALNLAGFLVQLIFFFYLYYLDWDAKAEEIHNKTHENAIGGIGDHTVIGEGSSNNAVGQYAQYNDVELTDTNGQQQQQQDPFNM